jgi:light-regulated signal transduction histidine kinase (bacteriophytochrome)
VTLVLPVLPTFAHAFASEPIHIPGAIQPHGAVLAALADRPLVTRRKISLSVKKS